MAAGDTYIVAGTTVVFGVDVPWTTRLGVINGEGAQSGQYDTGDPALGRTNVFRVRFYVKATGTLTAGQGSFDIYLKTSDAPADNSDNDVGNGDLAYGAALEPKLANLTPIGSARVDGPAGDEYVLKVEEVILNSRYLNVVMWNASGGTSSAVAADIALELTPITYQGQSA